MGYNSVVTKLLSTLKALGPRTEEEKKDGLESLSRKNAGSEEILGKGKYGLLTEQDEFLLYKALKAVIENVALRDDLRNKALERAELFNESTIMDQIYTVLG